MLESLRLAGPTFITTDAFRDVVGKDILAAAVQNGLEGVVAKRRDSAYRPGRRSPDWVKVKSFRTQEAVIGGWTEGRGERTGSLGALLLGIPGDDGLRYIGKVGTGFSERARRALLDELKPLAARSSPFASPLPAAEAAKAHFVNPEVVGEVEFAEWTTAVAPPPDLARPAPGQGAPRSRGRESGVGTLMAPSTSSTRTTIGGRELTVSNLEKVLFPAAGFTKGQLIDYYMRIAEVMLPHVSGRPLTMKRFPDGVEGKSFFEKHIPSHAPAWVKSVTVPSSDGHDGIPYAMVNDIATLAWAANLGTIEFHVPLWHGGATARFPRTRTSWCSTWIQARGINRRVLHGRRLRGR